MYLRPWRGGCAFRFRDCGTTSLWAVHDYLASSSFGVVRIVDLDVAGTIRVLIVVVAVLDMAVTATEVVVTLVHERRGWQCERESALRARGSG